MKQLLLVALLLLCLSFSSRLTAQVFEFSDIFELLDSTDRANAFNTLENLPTDGIDGLAGSGVIDSLFSALNGENPLPTNIDSSAFDAVRMLIDERLDTTLLTEMDIASILSRLDSIESDFFTGNFEDVFGNLTDTVGVLPILPIPNEFTQDADWAAGQDSANLDLVNAFMNSDPEGLRGNISTAIDQLFNPDLFSLILYAGVQNVTSSNFYGVQLEEEQASVLGIRSVRDFSQTAFAAWDAWGSFITGPVQVRDTNLEDNPQFAVDDDFTVLELAGNFTFYRTFGLPVGVRIISGVGVGVSTYGPDYEDLRPGNVGFSTACTAEVSGGVSFSFGDVNVYSLAAVSGGPVVNSPDYRYVGTKFEAAVELKRASLRYTISNGSWARPNQKILDSHVITVGIRL